MRQVSSVELQLKTALTHGNAYKGICLLRMKIKYSTLQTELTNSYLFKLGQFNLRPI
jgi:hypothetical protein